MAKSRGSGDCRQASGQPSWRCRVCLPRSWRRDRTSRRGRTGHWPACPCWSPAPRLHSTPSPGLAPNGGRTRTGAGRCRRPQARPCAGNHGCGPHVRTQSCLGARRRSRSGALNRIVAVPNGAATARGATGPAHGQFCGAPLNPAFFRCAGQFRARSRMSRNAKRARCLARRREWRRQAVASRLGPDRRRRGQGHFVLVGYALGHSAMSWTAPGSRSVFRPGAKVTISGLTEAGPFNAPWSNRAVTLGGRHLENHNTCHNRPERRHGAMAGPSRRPLAAGSSAQRQAKRRHRRVLAKR
jgi:hypothetical protein